MEFSSSSSSTSSQYKGSAFPANISRPRWELPIYESTPHFPQPSPTENRLIGVNSQEISSSILESGRLASSSSPSYTHYYAYGYSNYNHGGGGACAAGKEATMAEKREGGGDLPPGESAAAGEEEREHMFDKVVTPSDVGKLNRLVIPKQQAEKYFPLDSSSSEKGLLLDFEDRNGKSWRFRYSYWNSSQSYVMTKGWSRFVKEKKLDAGDVVSFQRGLGDDATKDRFYIDWRRRPDAPPPLAPPHHHHIQFQRGFSVHRPIHHQPFLLAGPRPPPPLPPPPLLVHPQARDQRQLMNFVSHPNQHSICSYNGLGTAATWSGYNGQNNNNYGVLAPNLCHQGSVIYMRGSTQHQMQLQGELAGISRRIQTTSSTGASSDEHMVFDSVPVVPAAVKRFRLFGVNMDCALTDGHDCESPVNPRALMSHTSSSTEEVERSLQLRLHGSAATSNSMYTTTDFLDKGKSSMSLDFDL